MLEVALGTPAALAQTVEAGLRPEPAERPSMAAFGTQLEAVAWQLISDTRQAEQQDAWREVLVDLDHRSTGLK